MDHYRQHHEHICPVMHTRMHNKITIKVHLLDIVHVQDELQADA